MSVVAGTGEALLAVTRGILLLCTQAVQTQLPGKHADLQELASSSWAIAIGCGLCPSRSCPTYHPLLFP
jgi:hypothetical protein